ncbi:beta-L-arabinofuranosidase domain-containing protein [Halorarum halobium]|uniref:beta-L-arabinofuranosidase domain-containing protein n=1 Tax=Halorarum halobium TaxID=3075121 RepID=UPI0028AF7C08|nr:beta-L-arabinofuranosidase domain-containing protein [Halobaculum sp. XH14]
MTDDSPAETKQVPDTLLLEDHAKLGLNALTGYVDQRRDHMPYFYANLKADPAKLCHSRWDYGSSVGRLTSSFALAREMTKSDDGADVEERLREKLLDFFEDDGLNYRQGSESYEKVANMHDQRSVLLGLVGWALSTDSEEPREAAADLCAGLKRIAEKGNNHDVDKDDFWYFPSAEHPRGGWQADDMIYLGMSVDPAHTSARMIDPLVKFYELTGNQDALDLAENFARHTVEYSGAFNADGSFNDGHEFRFGHFHSRTVSVASIARYGAITGDASYLTWAENIYDWILDQGTAFGWFPGALIETKAHHHETCTLTDIIEIGITLARNGYEEYWDDVERFVRNHLVETQLTENDWIVEGEESMNDEECVFTDVGERSLGAFPGWAAPHDFVCDVDHMNDIMTCCVASGVRGLFLAWDNAVTDEGDHLAVNLLVNRQTEQLDVESYLPHHGRLELTANVDLDEVRVRIPQWAENSEVLLEREDDEQTPEWRGTFVTVPDLAEDESVTITFPVKERESTEAAWNRDFAVDWRGDSVRSISPSGTHYPLYADREVYDDVPMRTVSTDRRRTFSW